MSINQKLFEIASNHLIQQNAKSISTTSNGEFKKGLCLYRGDNGLKCAIGSLIGDEHYNKGIEGLDIGPGNIMSLISATHGVAPEEVDVEMLFTLQDIHDHHETSEWSNLLKEVSNKYGYNWNPNI